MACVNALPLFGPYFPHFILGTSELRREKLGLPFHFNDILPNDHHCWLVGLSRLAGKKSFLTVHEQQEALILTSPYVYTTFVVIQPSHNHYFI